MMVQVKRVLGAGPAVLVAVACATLAACEVGGGGRAQDEAAVRELEDAVTSARDGVVRDLVAELEVAFVGGRRRFGFCGESYAPRGVRLEEHLTFDAAGLDGTEAAGVAARVLEEQGWTVDRPGNPAVATGRRGEVEVRVLAGPAALQLDVGNPDCVETADDVARDFGGRESEAVVWGQATG